MINIVGLRMQTRVAYIKAWPSNHQVTLFGWLWLVAGSDLLWEKNIADWLMLVAGADLVWEKNIIDWLQPNKVRILRLSNTLEKDADRLTGRECTIFKFQLYI